MERKMLLAKLETVAPALAANSIIPILTDFWFTGATLLAYNDHIGISVPLKTDFKGSVTRTLASLLALSRGDEAITEASNNELKVKIGKTNAKLAMRPATEFIFEMPQPTKGADIFSAEETSRFLGAVGDCLRSVGNDPSVVEQMGVTLVPDKSTLHVYATNNDTLSYAKVKMSKPITKRMILSEPFCQQLLALSAHRTMAVQIGEDHVLAYGDDKTLLYGRLLFSSDPLDFGNILKTHLPEFEKLGVEGIRKRMVDLSDSRMSRMRLILERANVVASLKLEPSKTQVTVTNGIMNLKSSASISTVVDQLKVSKEQADVSVRFDPAHLKIGYDGADRMLISERCAIFVKPNNSIYMVAASNR